MQLKTKHINGCAGSRPQGMNVCTGSQSQGNLFSVRRSGRARGREEEASPSVISWSHHDHGSGGCLLLLPGGPRCLSWCSPWPPRPQTASPSSWSQCSAHMVSPAWAERRGRVRCDNILMCRLQGQVSCGVSYNNDDIMSGGDQGGTEGGAVAC